MLFWERANGGDIKCENNEELINYNVFVVVNLAFVVSVEAALKDNIIDVLYCSSSVAGVGSSVARLQHGGH